MLDFIEFLVIHPGEFLVIVSESKIAELFIILYVEDNTAIFFDRGLWLPSLIS